MQIVGELLHTMSCFPFIALKLKWSFEAQCDSNSWWAIRSTARPNSRNQCHSSQLKWPISAKPSNVSDILRIPSDFLDSALFRAEDMLNGGIRFIDFRIMYTKGPDRAFGEKDWYCLHGCESQHKAIEYLKQIRKWLLVKRIYNAL